MIQIINLPLHQFVLSAKTCLLLHSANIHRTFAHAPAPLLPPRSNINYYKIQYATLCIRENPGCLFIATNRDAVTHLTDAQEWAGNGSMVRARAATETGLCASRVAGHCVLHDRLAIVLPHVAVTEGITGYAKHCMLHHHP